ncbi:hypothetical protein LR48_Vigan11g045200 [Vigna angularis]|uniref:Uncharacterized protein n=1 Tax=Phaseolus angularis TaxID=3914 RepID=A0A0L9VRN7_PHAAN|nr:hypothetical protein LR48_Vigan11g045200 [Vigna angularis]
MDWTVEIGDFPPWKHPKQALQRPLVSSPLASSFLPLDRVFKEKGPMEEDDEDDDHEDDEEEEKEDDEEEEEH